MAKIIPPLIKHHKHKIKIRRTNNLHAAEYWCCDCKKHIAWISKQDASKAEQFNLIKEI